MARKECIPLAVVRDLLGVTRALYRAEQAKARPDARLLDGLKKVGEQLNWALDLGRSPPDTMGSRAAWSWAEQATQALGELVCDLELEPAVRATIARLRR